MLLWTHPYCFRDNFVADQKFPMENGNGFLWKTFSMEICFDFFPRPMEISFSFQLNDNL